MISSARHSLRTTAGSLSHRFAARIAGTGPGSSASKRPATAAAHGLWKDVDVNVNVNVNVNVDVDVNVHTTAARGSICIQKRSFSSMQELPPDDPQAQFKPTPPPELNMEMARGIQSANHLILKHGVGKQRLELLAREPESKTPLVVKWQRMMEIYLGAQLHVVAALGYETSEQGIMLYTQQLAQFVGTKCDPSVQEDFRAKGRDTWREMLVVAFGLDREAIEEKYGNELSIVDARNIVHRVATALIEPEILEEVATRVGQLPPQTDPQTEMGLKHSIIQDVVVNNVYLGGETPLTEELGFGTGSKGYALMQYVMAYHESDPLCAQYTSSSMTKIWKAAGLDLGEANPVASKLPMSGPQ